MHTEEKTINRMLGLDQLNQNAPMYKRWTKYCLQWYIRKANRNRIGYYFLSIITVLFPLLNAAFINMDERYLPEFMKADISEVHMFFTVLSILTSLASSMLALFNVKEKWNIYRSAADYLKMQYVEFEESGTEKTGQEIHEYIKKINDHMQQIHAKWQSVAFQEEKQLTQE